METDRIRRLAMENGVAPSSVLQLPEEESGTTGTSTTTVGRVCGLAVSRSIGARYAFPYVIPDPDVSEVQVALCASSPCDDDHTGGREAMSGGGGSSGAMGLRSLSEPAANVTAGDVWALLLCSDGVWDALTDQEAAEVPLTLTLTPNPTLTLTLNLTLTPTQRGSRSEV